MAKKKVPVRVMKYPRQYKVMNPPNFVDIVELDESLGIDPGNFHHNAWLEYRDILFEQYGSQGIPNGTYFEVDFEQAAENATYVPVKRYFQKCQKATAKVRKYSCVRKTLIYYWW
jgi:hypothetical protein